MRLSIRMLLLGLCCIPLGVVITWMGFQDGGGGIPLYPAGKWMGPLVSLLGVALTVMMVRSMKQK